VTPSASIVIPTHNGGTRAAGVLRGLAASTFALRATVDRGALPEMPTGGFEVIVVDNASTEDVEATVSRDPAWRALSNAGVRCRVVREPVPGLTSARLRGIAEAASDIICFLDDDTIPCEGYVTSGIAAFEDPGLGMLTSRVFPRYEVEPSPAIARREHMLAINHRLGDKALDWGATATVAPTIGAGMWIRRQALARVLDGRETARWLPDRKGASLSSGGDIELGVMVGAAGFRRVYLPELRLEHCIPAGRVQMDYFRRLVASIVRSHLAVTCRYPPRPWTLRDRLRAIAEYGGALLAVPVLLLRKDGWRETSLVLTARRAAIRGPEEGP
jgi:glycosyltransferase involved in cell wall biosynthesis